nr:unnamed protein product [Brassica rapa]
MVNQVWFGHDDRWLYSTCIVEGAQRAINTSHFQAESNENGLGFVMLWVFTVHFISKEKVDSWSSLRNRSKLNGHMVIVLAEEHGKS